MARKSFAAALAFCLLANGFCYPHLRPRKRDTENNDQQNISPETPTSSAAVAAEEITPSDDQTSAANEIPPPIPYDDDDDDDDDFEPMNASSSGGGGSNIFSLLRIAGAILPSSSNAGVLRNLIRALIKLNKPPTIRRQFIDDNEIEIDYIAGLKPPPFQKQQSSDESNSDSKSESNELNNNAAEESLEDQNDNNSKEDSGSNNASVDDDSDYDSDEPPGGGDGQGGGILGLLAGLSGGEDGQSDLGSLLATVSGIVANLSGDGIDLNALIASGIGLFVGLLSEGEENPGAVIASYLLTSLDTITGGGSKNNGAFFGTFLSKLVKGTSAIQNSADAPSPVWTLKLDILRALVQFVTSVLGMASSSSFAASSG